MTRFIRPLAAAAFLAACGHGSISGNAGSIEGTVATSSGRALTVSAPASGKSATTDATGAFFLTNVPAGTSELHVSGGADDATLHIQALGSGEHRSMSITVSGQTAQEDESQTSSGFDGEVTAVNPPNLTVAGRLVHTDTNTKILRGDVSIAVGDIKVGEKAAVEGALQADGSVLATRIEVGAEGEDPPSFAVFKGVLNKIDGTHLTVGILPVLLQPQTAIFRGETQVDATALQVGQNLLVMGIVDATQGILAARIRILVPDNGDDNEAHLQGKVTAVAAHSLTVNDKVIAVDASTQFGGAGDPKSLADLKVGDVVEVDVVTAADTSLLAKEIERLPASAPPPFIEAKGTVEATTADGITVSGAHFAVDSHTMIFVGDHAATLADLTVGQMVEVKAMPRPSLPPLAIAIHGEL